MNDRMILCPKCQRPGILYAQRSITALIGSRLIAHVLHIRAGENRQICMLRRSEFERIPHKTNRRLQ